ncbi:MAG: hypothetical protein HOH89_06280 [Alphaproteobacteria bacterium]|nr:hypothetical protein [Alphaproteobacteria bacterium]
MDNQDLIFATTRGRCWGLVARRGLTTRRRFITCWRLISCWGLIIYATLVRRFTICTVICWVFTFAAVTGAGLIASWGLVAWGFASWGLVTRGFVTWGFVTWGLVTRGFVAWGLVILWIIVIFFIVVILVLVITSFFRLLLLQHLFQALSGRLWCFFQHPLQCCRGLALSMGGVVDGGQAQNQCRSASPHQALG